MVKKTELNENNNEVANMQLEAQTCDGLRLISYSNDLIFLFGFDGEGMPDKLIEANSKVCEMLGYTKDELLTMAISDIVCEECVNEIPQIIKSLLKHKCATCELCYKSKSGNIIPIELSLSIFNFKGEEVALATARDITECKRVEEALRKSKERYELLVKELEHDMLKTEFLANLSHELKTPLNVIISTVQIFNMYLKENIIIDSDKKVYKYANILRQNCNRLLRLVNNMIDITKIDSGFFDIYLQNYNIVQIVEEITLSVAEYIENKSISLLFDTDVEEKIMACDPDKIERIILNLLSNAIKFTTPGGSIIVKIYDKPDSIIISVKDTGIGIPEDKLAIIFERFRQVDKSLARNHEGNGIGLALVKSLVEMHGGRIMVKSEWGKGSEFLIEIPVRIVESNNVRVLGLDDPRKNIEKIYIEFSDIYNIG